MTKINHDRKGRLKYDPYKVYIPENLNLDNLIANHPLPPGVHRDQITYIVHLITSIPANIKDYDIEKNKGYTTINKKFLCNRIHSYRKCLDYLKEHKVIQEGTSYKPGDYSRGIKFTPEYQTKVVPVFIQKNTLIKSIVSRNDNRDLKAEGKTLVSKRKL